MVIFHAKGKVELTVPIDNLGILHVTKKCLCVMFGFHMGTVHVSKDKMYDDNNNVIRSIYQVPVLGDFGLEWKVNAERFKIIAKDLTKSSESFDTKNCDICCKCHFISYGYQARGCPKMCRSLTLFIDFVQFVQ
jgi:hypothetical protein